MIDRVFGIKERMSGLNINRYRPIIGRLLNADYRPADNRPLPYRCISSLPYNLCCVGVDVKHCPFLPSNRQHLQNYVYGHIFFVASFSYLVTVDFRHFVC